MSLRRGPGELRQWEVRVQLVALLMTQMWVVRLGGEGNPAMHVVIAQVSRGERV